MLCQGAEGAGEEGGRLAGELFSAGGDCRVPLPLSCSPKLTAEHDLHPLVALPHCYSEELSDDRVWVAIAPDALSADKDIAPDDFQVCFSGEGGGGRSAGFPGI